MTKVNSLCNDPKIKRRLHEYLDKCHRIVVRPSNVCCLQCLGFSYSFMMAGGQRRAMITSDDPFVVAMSRSVLPFLFFSVKIVSIPATWSISFIFWVTQVVFFVEKHIQFNAVLPSLSFAMTNSFPPTSMSILVTSNDTPIEHAKCNAVFSEKSVVIMTNSFTTISMNILMIWAGAPTKHTSCKHVQPHVDSFW